MTRVRRHLAQALLTLAGLGLAPASAAPDELHAETPGAIASIASAPIDSRVARVSTDSDDAHAPVFSQPILRARVRAQERILGRDLAVEDEFGRIVPAQQVVLNAREDSGRENGNALGRFVPVENESALEHFQQALAALASRPDQKNKVRIAVYGASHTQADIYSGYLRYYLQSRFGNGGPGFIPMGVERSWSRRLDFKVQTRGFKVQYAQHKSPPPHGRFGLSGAAAVAGPHAWVKVSPENSTDPDLTATQYGLFYAAEPQGGDISISVDGEKLVQLPTRAPELEARYHTFERPLGWHDVEIRTLGSGGVRLFGLSVERAQPGLVVDTLGIRGTRAASMLQWDQALWEEHLRRRAPDLVLLAYGTNETTDRGQPIEVYSRDLRQVLVQLRRALPSASCVLVGPGDFPKSENGAWATRPRLLEIIAEQRRLAPEFDCGFWDTFEFMGGPGSMDNWVRANPRLGAPDHIHFTPRGYVRMGMVLGDALLRAYDARSLPNDERVAAQRSLAAGVSGATNSL